MSCNQINHNKSLTKYIYFCIALSIDLSINVLIKINPILSIIFMNYRKNRHLVWRSFNLNSENSPLLFFFIINLKLPESINLDYIWRSPFPSGLTY